MTRRLPDLEAWAIFAAVAEQGSFAGAARELGLADPTVSKAIARLEARLGTSLIARTSRRLTLTDAGREAAGHAARLLAEGEAADAKAAEQSRAPRGRIRISEPVSFGIAYLAAALPAFLAAYPEIVLEFALSDRKVDLVADGFDVALRIAALDDSSLRARRLCAVRRLLVAAPAYLAAQGSPASPADLTGHRAMAYTGGHERGTWRFVHPVLGEEAVTPAVHLWTDNADLLMPALLAGHGLAVQPEFLVWRELRAGTLVEVLPEWTVPPLGLHLLMPPSPLRPARVEILIDHLARALADPPWQAFAGTRAAL